MISLPDVPVISVNHYNDRYDKLPGAFFGENSTAVEIKVGSFRRYLETLAQLCWYSRKFTSSSSH